MRRFTRKDLFDSTITKAVVKVGDGRGFVMRRRIGHPRFKGKWSAAREPIIITAAHCLPFVPPPHAARHLEEYTFPRLLGTLDAPQDHDVWAECLFIDPMADIAVLGEPDGQALVLEYEAYRALTEGPPAFRVCKTPTTGRAWLLSLEREWVPCDLNVLRNGLTIRDASEVKSGMSGSPILADDGTVIGVVCIPELPNPVLVHNLPGWLLRSL